MRPAVTIVIPVLHDTDAAAALLAQIAPDPDVDVVVVEGIDDPAGSGGGDGALGAVVARHPRATLRRTHVGRGHQMNSGAAGTRGEWLLFLHADSVLPEHWFAALRSIGPGIIGGWFRFALDDMAWQARVIERLVAWRVRRLTLPYGDQGLFVRRRTFEALGGFREWPLLEDVDFVRRLARAGDVVELPLALVTSARKWRRDGWFRRSTKNLAIVVLYWVGVPPERLERWYRHRSARAATRVAPARSGSRE
jgi:rSAM/selenodomain-associated transferase 2